MEKKEESKIKLPDANMFKSLSTMIPAEVHEELTEMARDNASYTGAWDYGNAIKELLWIKKVFYNVNTRLDEVEVSINELKSFVMENVVESEQKQEPKKESYGLLGKRKEKGVDKNGKD